MPKTDDVERLCVAILDMQISQLLNFTLNQGNPSENYPKNGEYRINIGDCEDWINIGDCNNNNKNNNNNNIDNDDNNNNNNIDNDDNNNNNKNNNRQH